MSPEEDIKDLVEEVLPFGHMSRSYLSVFKHQRLDYSFTMTLLQQKAPVYTYETDYLKVYFTCAIQAQEKIFL